MRVTSVKQQQITVKLKVIFWILTNGVFATQDLVFNGEVTHSTTTSMFMISCASASLPVECTMEFFHNNATIEILRYSVDGCYSTHEKCSFDLCSCEEDCKSFYWNLTTSIVEIDDSFGCGIRVNDTNIISKIYMTVKYNGTDFISPTTIRIPGNTFSKTTLAPGKQISSLDTVVIVLSVLGSMITLVIVVACTVYCLKTEVLYIEKLLCLQKDETTTIL